uniref:MscS mechanosensitive ion channel n=1 Tax=uncultured bacterium 89 TaxID=698393 RepID=E3T690_9BACT|nr:MscS mechanosensitive ion channel [uncultured bacterium 89]
MDWNNILKVIEATLTGVGLQVLGAIALYIIGRWLISFAVGLLKKALSGQHIEPTLMRFIGNTIVVILNITLVIAILGYFGVQTTSFAALLAGAGLAIGSAWGGLLANFAAGIFLVVLRPFKVGDFISAGGTTGTVEEVGLFVTKIDTPDNVCTYVGNNKLFADNIQNFSTNAYRRVDLGAQISGAADPKHVISALKERIRQIPNVAAKPEPDVVISSFTPAGPVLAIRPYTNNAFYWQVYFDTNMAIREVLGDGAFPAPMPVFGIQQLQDTAARA